MTHDLYLSRTAVRLASCIALVWRSIMAMWSSSVYSGSLGVGGGAETCARSVACERLAAPTAPFGRQRALGAGVVEEVARSSTGAGAGAGAGAGGSTGISINLGFFATALFFGAGASVGSGAGGSVFN